MGISADLRSESRLHALLFTTQQAGLRQRFDILLRAPVIPAKGDGQGYFERGCRCCDDV
jgi:hypothetical protein